MKWCQTGKRKGSRPRRKCSRGYRKRPVFCADPRLVDSTAMIPSQMKAGIHSFQGWTRSELKRGLSGRAQVRARVSEERLPFGRRPKTSAEILEFGCGVGGCRATTTGAAPATNHAAARHSAA